MFQWVRLVVLECKVMIENGISIICRDRTSRVDPIHSDTIQRFRKAHQVLQWDDASSINAGRWINILYLAIVSESLYMVAIAINRDIVVGLVGCHKLVKSLNATIMIASSKSIFSCLELVIQRLGWCCKLLLLFSIHKRHPERKEREKETRNLTDADLFIHKHYLAYYTYTHHTLVPRVTKLLIGCFRLVPIASFDLYLIAYLDCSFRDSTCRGLVAMVLTWDLVCFLLSKERKGRRVSSDCHYLIVILLFIP